MEISVLSSEDIERIDGASIRILERTGVEVPHEEMRNRFEKAGAKVDHGSKRVRIPEKLVRECVGKAGKTFAIYGRDRKNAAEFGTGKRNYNSIAGEASWIERDGTRRYARLDDVVEAAKLGEMLPGLTIVGAMADPYEIPAAYRCVEVAAAQLRHTTKPITFWFHDRASAEYIIELFGSIAGSAEEARERPYGYPFLEPISPLRFPRDGIDLLFETCKVPLPVPIGPMAQVGLSAPCTLAGTMAVENAEILAGVCVTQLIREGTPVCYGGICHAFDMRTTQMVFSGPEQALMGVSMTQMGKHYGLPVYINVGLTDSKVPDAQAGLEVGITLAMGALAGADIFGHLGIAGVDQASDLDMLVLQHEAIGYVERMMRGVQVDDEKLAVDLINEVGPGGTFIDRMHTVKHMRQELWQPRLLDRQYWSTWEEGGRKDMRGRAREYREELMRAYEPRPLPDDVERDVDKVLKSARKHLGR